MRTFLVPTRLEVWPERSAWWGVRWMPDTEATALNAELQSLFYELKIVDPTTIERDFRVLVRRASPAALTPESQSLAYGLGLPRGSLRVDCLIDVEGLSSTELDAKVNQLERSWREPAVEFLELTSLREWAKAQVSIASLAVDPSAHAREHWPEGLGTGDIRAAEQMESELGRALTFTEVLLLEQSWSEHCRHRIFRAKIELKDTGVHVDSLLNTYLREPARKLNSSRVVSMFHDNAGVLKIFDPHGNETDWGLAVKMETHNSPSAIAPRAGAATGLVGVHRDILGVGQGAKPVFNWNVLCVESEQHNEPRPESALPASQVRKGVLSGIQEGSNHSGVATLTGSMLMDSRYAVKPAVFAGSAGILPLNRVKKNFPKNQFVFVVGGATGRDGLGGAVMSSRDLRHSDMAGSAVQVADPYIQRRLTDFLIRARDTDLLEAITDNGAGGLASSLGELGELAGGLDVDLSSLRVKFQGLAAWEKFLSESQERMTVFTTRRKEFTELADSMGVEWDFLGTTNSTGRLRVRHSESTIVDLPYEFIFDRCPNYQLSTPWGLKHDLDWVVAERSKALTKKRSTLDFAKLLSLEDLCSRRRISERFDHEVQGRSLKKPFQGVHESTPGDGALCEVYEARTFVSLGHGLAPQRLDIHENVLSSLDEAVKHFVIAGGRLETAALLDNFSWADPTVNSADGQRRLWRLWRAASLLGTASELWKLPFISGKDSMKNNSAEFSQPETLVVSCAGSACAPERVPSGFFCRPNDVVFWVPHLSASLCESAADRAGVMCPPELLKPWFAATELPRLDAELEKILIELGARHRALESLIRQGLLRSAKDVSEGGVMTTVFEMCLGRELGFLWQQESGPGLAELQEGLGSFVVAVDPHFSRRVEQSLKGAVRLGVVVRPFQWRWPGGGLELQPLREAYERAGREGFFG